MAEEEKEPDAEPPKVEVVKSAEQEELRGFIEEAKDAMGLADLDLPALIKEVMKVGEEDKRWRAEVMRRLEILVNNQRLIYAAVTGDLKPIIQKGKE